MEYDVNVFYGIEPFEAFTEALQAAISDATTSRDFKKAKTKSDYRAKLRVSSLRKQSFLKASLRYRSPLLLIFWHLEEKLFTQPQCLFVNLSKSNTKTLRNASLFRPSLKCFRPKSVIPWKLRMSLEYQSYVLSKFEL